MLVLHFLAVVCDHFDLFSQRIIIRQKGATITKATQIFRREERCTADGPHCSCLHCPSIRENIFRTNGLGGIFYYLDVMLLGGLQNDFHVCALPVKVNRYDCFCLWSYFLLKLARINIESLLIDIYKDRLQSQQCNDLRCRHVGMYWQNHFIPRFNIQDH